MPRKLSEFFGILIILVVIFGNLCDGFNKKKGSIDLRKLKDRFHLHQNLLASPTKVNSKERHNKSYKDDELGLLESVWGRKDDSSLMGDDDDGDAAEVITTSYGPPPSIRLPREVTPIHYFLEIIPLLDNETETIGKIWTAPGNVRILVEAAKPERKITLHALGLNISDVQVINRNSGQKINVSGHEYSKAIPDQYILSLEEAMKVGERYEIGVTFVAPIALKQADGLYRSAYKDVKSNTTKYLVSTQFEFFNARQVFPCFDEPGLKATFDISIGRSGNHTTLSNSNLVSTVPLLGTFGWYIDTFNTTVVMPTYVVAFVVSDYTYAEADSSILKNRPVRVYGPSTVINEGGGQFGAEVSAKVLSFYENYFDSEYPMPKMDSASIPGFQYGAMENYGLNVYREGLLLTGEYTTEHQKRLISNVIAHESAHQYFGNLVTCKWWDNIWLNEGFATYYSYIGQNATNPEYEPLKQLFADSTQYALNLDSRERSSYPLLLTANSQSGLERQAVGLPYYKGAALIRMMNGFLTPQTFEKGIKRYLKRWAYKAAEQDDLFEILTEQGHEDGTLPEDMTVKGIMDPWTKQRGYPLVRVISSDNDTVYVLYERFESINMAKSDKLVSWSVPISYVSESEPDFKNNTVPKVWIPEGKVLITLKHNLSEWIIVNPDATGFYRVVYDNKITRMLQDQFEKDHTAISAMSRSQIMDDYFTLANQGDLPISSALDFTRHLRQESEEIVWGIFLKNVKQLYYFYSEVEVDNSTRSTPEFQSFQKYIVPRLEAALKKIGLEQVPGEKGMQVSFRAKLLDYACRFGSPLCLGYARRLFELWHANYEVDPVPVDMKRFMYCYGVAAGGPLNWLLVYQQYTNETSEFSSNLYLAKSLGCVKNQKYLAIILESLLDGSMPLDFLGIRYMLQGIITNPLGRPVMLVFLKNHLKKFQTKFNETSDTLLFHILYDISDYLHTEKDLMEIQSALGDKNEEVESESYFLYDYVEDINDNIEWMTKSYSPMKAWFDQQVERENALGLTNSL